MCPQQTQKAQHSTVKECGDFAASKGKQGQQTCRAVISQKELMTGRETDTAALSNLLMAVTQVEAAWSYLLTGGDGHL